MKALLYKDLVSAKFSYLISLILIIVISFFSVGQGEPMMIPLIFMLVPVIISGISFAIEEKEDTAKFIFITPVSRNTYVISKYVIGIFCSLLAVLFTLILAFSGKIDKNAVWLIVAASIAVPGIISAIQLPFLFKFGAEKGRFLMAIAYMLIFVAATALGNESGKIMQLIQKFAASDMRLIGLIIIGISVLIYIASILISQRIIQNNEY